MKSPFPRGQSRTTAGEGGELGSELAKIDNGTARMMSAETSREALDWRRRGTLREVTVANQGHKIQRQHKIMRLEGISALASCGGRV